MAYEQRLSAGKSAEETKPAEAVATSEWPECKKSAPFHKDDCSWESPQKCNDWVREMNKKAEEDYEKCLHPWSTSPKVDTAPRPAAQPTANASAASPCTEWSEGDCLPDYPKEFRACVKEVREHNEACRQQHTEVKQRVKQLAEQQTKKLACDEAKKTEQKFCVDLPHQIVGIGKDQIEARAEAKRDCEAAREKKATICPEGL